MKRLRVCLGLGGAVLWAALVVSPVRRHLEATMTLQMLVQIPLLALAGWLCAQCIPRWLDRGVARWNRQGVSGLLLASLASLMWMLPRALDAALSDPRITMAKFLSVPLLIGVPVALSWPYAAFVVRGLVLTELIATLLRLGWLYLISPVRLCSNYLLDDQVQLGGLLLEAGVVILLLVAWKLIWGNIDIPRADHEES